MGNTVHESTGQDSARLKNEYGIVYPVPTSAMA